MTEMSSESSFATNTSPPRLRTALGPLPTETVPTIVPSVSLITETLSEPEFATKISPSDGSYATAEGAAPTGMLNVAGGPSSWLFADSRELDPTFPAAPGRVLASAPVAISATATSTAAVDQPSRSLG